MSCPTDAMPTRFELTDDNGRQITELVLQKVREAKLVSVSDDTFRLLLQIDDNDFISILLPSQVEYAPYAKLLDQVWDMVRFLTEAGEVQQYPCEWIPMHKYRRQRREGPLSKFFTRPRGENAIPTISSQVTIPLVEPEDPAKRQKTSTQVRSRPS